MDYKIVILNYKVTFALCKITLTKTYRYLR